MVRSSSTSRLPSYYSSATKNRTPTSSASKRSTPLPITIQLLPSTQRDDDEITIPAFILNLLPATTIRELRQHTAEYLKKNNQQQQQRRSQHTNTLHIQHASQLREVRDSNGKRIADHKTLAGEGLAGKTVYLIVSGADDDDDDDKQKESYKGLRTEELTRRSNSRSSSASRTPARRRDESCKRKTPSQRAVEVASSGGSRKERQKDKEGTRRGRRYSLAALELLESDDDEEDAPGCDVPLPTVEKDEDEEVIENSPLPSKSKKGFESDIQPVEHIQSETSNDADDDHYGFEYEYPAESWSSPDNNDDDDEEEVDDKTSTKAVSSQQTQNQSQSQDDSPMLPAARKTKKTKTVIPDSLEPSQASQMSPQQCKQKTNAHNMLSKADETLQSSEITAQEVEEYDTDDTIDVEHLSAKQNLLANNDTQKPQGKPDPYDINSAIHSDKDDVVNSPHTHRVLTSAVPKLGEQNTTTLKRPSSLPAAMRKTSLTSRLLASTTAGSKVGVHAVHQDQSVPPTPAIVRKNVDDIPARNKIRPSSSPSSSPTSYVAAALARNRAKALGHPYPANTTSRARAVTPEKKRQDGEEDDEDVDEFLKRAGEQYSAEKPPPDPLLLPWSAPPLRLGRLLLGEEDPYWAVKVAGRAPSSRELREEQRAEDEAKEACKEYLERLDAEKTTGGLATSSFRSPAKDLASGVGIATVAEANNKEEASSLVKKTSPVGEDKEDDTDQMDIDLSQDRSSTDSPPIKIEPMPDSPSIFSQGVLSTTPDEVIPDLHLNDEDDDFPPGFFDVDGLPVIPDLAEDDNEQEQPPLPDLPKTDDDAASALSTDLDIAPPPSAQPSKRKHDKLESLFSDAEEDEEARRAQKRQRKAERKAEKKLKREQRQQAAEKERLEQEQAERQRLKQLKDREAQEAAAEAAAAKSPSARHSSLRKKQAAAQRRAAAAARRESDPWLEEQRKLFALEEAHRRGKELEILVSSPLKAAEQGIFDSEDSSDDDGGAWQREMVEADRTRRRAGTPAPSLSSSSPSPSPTAAASSKVRTGKSGGSHKKQAVRTKHEEKDHDDGPVLSKVSATPSPATLPPVSQTDAAAAPAPATSFVKSQERIGQHQRPVFDEWAFLEATLGNQDEYSPQAVHDRIHLNMVRASLQAAASGGSNKSEHDEDDGDHDVDMVESVEAGFSESTSLQQAPPPIVSSDSLGSDQEMDSTTRSIRSLSPSPHAVEDIPIESTEEPLDEDDDMEDEVEDLEMEEDGSETLRSVDVRSFSPTPENLAEIKKDTAIETQPLRPKEEKAAVVKSHKRRRTSARPKKSNTGATKEKDRKRKKSRRRKSDQGLFQKVWSERKASKSRAT